jgi:hypothetical protein
MALATVSPGACVKGTTETGWIAMNDNSASFVKIDLDSIDVKGTGVTFHTVDGPQSVRCKDRNNVAEILNAHADRWTPNHENGKQINPNLGDFRYTYRPPKRTFYVDEKK